ncbi:MAG: SDR family oxidoreductase [Leptolyngbya sp. BL-A-14]
MARLILVVGGSGRTGRLIVQKLQKAGYAVRVLTRSLKKAQALFDPTVDIVEGDLTQRRSVETAMHGVESVIVAVESADSDDASNAPKQVHYQGMCTILAVAKKSTHIVLVTQIYMTRPNLYPEMSNIIAWRGKAEESVRVSELPYTIVRPAWLTDSSTNQEIYIEQGDQGEGRVSREALAEVCVRALSHEASRGKTFEIYSRTGTSSLDWSSTFASLQSDLKPNFNQAS